GNRNRETDAGNLDENADLSVCLSVVLKRVVLLSPLWLLCCPCSWCQRSLQYWSPPGVCGAMAVKPSVARGEGTYADPGWVGEEPVVVETRGRVDGTPGVDWT
uniref:Uncharacterized protein n=1 Tax=Kryptolebias marmoratus TaxID=37003 RepID=A0A3Q3FL06_KRYMA